MELLYCEDVGLYTLRADNDFERNLFLRIWESTSVEAYQHARKYLELKKVFHSPGEVTFDYLMWFIDAERICKEV